MAQVNKEDIALTRFPLSVLLARSTSGDTASEASFSMKTDDNEVGDNGLIPVPPSLRSLIFMIAADCAFRF